MMVITFLWSTITGSQDLINDQFKWYLGSIHSKIVFFDSVHVYDFDCLPVYTVK